MRYLMPAALTAILLTGCAETMAGGDAGCAAYGEARLSLPREAVLAGDPVVADWVLIDLDTRLTEVCR